VPAGAPPSRLLNNPLQHDIKGEPHVPDLAVVLALLLPREDPRSHRPGILQDIHLLVMHLQWDEMIFSTGQDQDILLHEFQVEVLFVEPEKHFRRL